MITFIRAMRSKSDDQTNIDKNRAAANIIYIKINLPKNHQPKIDFDKASISCKNVNHQIQQV